MTLTDLKIIAMLDIIESDLSKEDKLKLLEIIKEIDQYQTMGFIMDQKIYNLNETGKKEIKKRFYIEETIYVNATKAIKKLPVKGKVEFIKKFGKKIKGLKHSRKWILTKSKNLTIFGKKMSKEEILERVRRHTSAIEKLKKGIDTGGFI